ncbi:hypothetical protein PENSPDRAFT_695364 [Peniophora sp. CONT]|nr:hypothetical protein PENSPDRAFT_695364 [Peniophora sp. CONT]
MPSHMTERTVFATYMASYIVHELRGETELDIPSSVEEIEYSALRIDNRKYFLVVYGTHVGITDNESMALNASSIRYGTQFSAPSYQVAYTWYRYWVSEMLHVLANGLDVSWGDRDFLLVAARSLSRKELRSLPVMKPQNAPEPFVPDVPPETLIIDIDDEENEEDDDETSLLSHSSGDGSPVA